jgi:pantoate--beta-alanine ligase
MKILQTIEEAHQYSFSQQIAGFSVGLVPTMGALHEGHLSLIEYARQDNSVTIASIFVNPIQFNNPNDLAKYPRTLEEDLRMLENAGCTAVFAPGENEMYAQKPALKVDFGSLEHVQEGAFRPGHFSGVGVVVSKLFNIIQPQWAYFGQKDLQQFLVIRRLVTDFSFQVRLRCCPIVREADGLAMSSRNRRLSPEKRPYASGIYESLRLAEKTLLEEGIAAAKAAVATYWATRGEFELEYFEIASADTLEPLSDPTPARPIALCIAGYLDGVRLIDNLLIE